MDKENFERELVGLLEYLKRRNDIYNTKPLKSREDAKRYLEEIRTGLMMLHDNSMEVGLTSHAAMFVSLFAAFSTGANAVERMCNVIQMQAETELAMLTEK